MQLDAIPKCVNAWTKTLRGVLAPKSAEASFRQTHAVCKQNQAPFRHCLQTFCCMSLLSHIPKLREKSCPWSAVSGMKSCKSLLLSGVTWNLTSQQQWTWVSMEQAWLPAVAFRLPSRSYTATLPTILMHANCFPFSDVNRLHLDIRALVQLLFSNHCMPNQGHNSFCSCEDPQRLCSAQALKTPSHAAAYALKTLSPFCSYVWHCRVVAMRLTALCSYAPPCRINTRTQ